MAEGRNPPAWPVVPAKYGDGIFYTRELIGDQLHAAHDFSGGALRLENLTTRIREERRSGIPEIWRWSIGAADDDPDAITMQSEHGTHMNEWITTALGTRTALALAHSPAWQDFFRRNGITMRGIVPTNPRGLNAFLRHNGDATAGQRRTMEHINRLRDQGVAERDIFAARQLLGGQTGYLGINQLSPAGIDLSRDWSTGKAFGAPENEAVRSTYWDGVDYATIVHDQWQRQDAAGNLIYASVMPPPWDWVPPQTAGGGAALAAVILGAMEPGRGSLYATSLRFPNPFVHGLENGDHFRHVAASGHTISNFVELCELTTTTGRQVDERLMRPILLAPAVAVAQRRLIPGYTRANIAELSERYPSSESLTVTEAGKRTAAEEEQVLNAEWRDFRPNVTPPTLRQQLRQGNRLAIEARAAQTPFGM